MDKKLFFRKLKNRLYVKYISPLKQKTFSWEGEQIHYMFYPKKSETMLVIFSAYNDNGPRYDYVTSLSRAAASRLYIKDDFVPRTGNYYLGRNGKFTIEKGVFALIDAMREKCGAKKLIFIGSSKGGYAAVNFGIAYEGSVMITAAPQYLLTRYMVDTAKKFIPAFADIVGEPVTEEKKEAMNRRLPDKVLSDPFGPTQKMYMHCSVNDKTYEKHVQYMLEDMEKAGIQIHFDKRDYEGHDTLKYYFPDYLKDCVEKET